MARYVHGIHGPLVGSLGNLVASSWRGIPYLKSRPRRRKAYTPNERKNQGNFGMTTKWLRPLTDHLRAGFKGDNPRLWGFNGAKSYLHAHALIEEGGSKVIDPSKVLISQGHLPLGEGFEMHFDAETFEVTVRWDPQTPKGGAASDDKLMLAVYDVEGGEVFGEVYGVSRKQGMERVELPSGLVATYHVYVAFVAADGSSRSDSLYLGSIRVGADQESEEEEDLGEEVSETFTNKSVSQSADSKQPISRRPPKKLNPSPPDQGQLTAQQHWQSCASSRHSFSYSYSYTSSYGSGGETSPHKKTTAGFPAAVTFTPNVG